MMRGLNSVLCSLFAVSLFAGVARAQATASACSALRGPRDATGQPWGGGGGGGGQPEAADVSSIKMGNDHGVGFIRRHEGFLKDRRAKNGKVGVLFVGDSITDGWRSAAARRLFARTTADGARSTSASAATAPSTSSGGSSTARSTASAPRSRC